MGQIEFSGYCFSENRQRGSAGQLGPWKETSECATAVVLKMRPLEGQESKVWSSDLRRGRDQKCQCSREREGVRAHLMECVHRERGVQNFDVGLTSSVF